MPGPKPNFAKITAAKIQQQTFGDVFISRFLSTRSRQRKGLLQREASIKANGVPAKWRGSQDVWPFERRWRDETSHTTTLGILIVILLSQKLSRMVIGLTQFVKIHEKNTYQKLVPVLDDWSANTGHR